MEDGLIGSLSVGDVTIEQTEDLTTKTEVHDWLTDMIESLDTGEWDEVLAKAGIDVNQ